MIAALRNWARRLGLRYYAIRLDIDIEQADKRFDLESPTTSELVMHEANKALREKIRKELS